MTFLNVGEIESAITALGAAYPSAAQVIHLPFETAEHRWSNALRIATGSCQETGVLLISGTHAREWGGPDILINLAADLLAAWSAGTGLVYQGTSFTSVQVRRILQQVELIVFPDINPDGRHHSQTVDPIWRKNRNPSSSNGTDPRSIGVDVNRNYDFLWDYPVYFEPTAVNFVSLASTIPASDLFHGTAPFSEAESKNVRWLFDTYPLIRRFVDIHSFGGNILHPWGDDANQSTTASKNFMNPAWNGKRGLVGDAYAEYVAAGDLTAVQTAGNAVKAAIAGVRGESYNVAQSIFMPGWATPYPTSGASHDWVFSRHYADPARPRILSYLVEFNKDWGQFFPTWTEMEKIILDVDAGLVRFCLDATPSWKKWCLFDFCCWKDRFWATWKRLFPPDLWGPYGPWDRVRRVMLAVVQPVVTVTAGLVARVLGRRSRG
jgi:murein tripeptide amidase MpaA